MFHLIEDGSYEEAKEVIEGMVLDRESIKWPRTWYARGVLAHEAYAEGIKKKDKKKYELYPEQLQVAYKSFERALRLDKSGRLSRQVAPRYVYIANEFQKKGEQQFKNENFEEAFQFFQSAITISQSEILEVKTDTNLIYNAALAAYESNHLDQAADYLIVLDGDDFSPNVSHLLFDMYMERGDTIEAEQVLINGIEKYKESEDLVLLLADNLYNRNQWNRAIEILDTAAQKQPNRDIFPFTQGLIYQKNEQYRKAISAYKQAHELSPDNLHIYVNIATCFYNIGVEIDEYART
ncbi:MAG: tetratricopeptide repeat protein, partial [Bacteroidota bacterium]